MSVFANLLSLKQDMEQNNWVIEGFRFSYLNRNYIVLAKLFLETESRPRFALIKLEFIREDDLEIRHTFKANRNGFYDTSPRELREFFGIGYSENLGEILQQFTEYFSNFIPPAVTLNKPEHIKNSMVSSLSQSDSEDPSRIYCFDVRRNGGCRSIFNDNKTRLLRPQLYANFENDNNLSFHYSDSPGREASDTEILLNFANRNN
jgi:hypothetical protein